MKTLKIFISIIIGILFIGCSSINHTTTNDDIYYTPNKEKEEMSERIVYLDEIDNNSTNNKVDDNIIETSQNSKDIEIYYNQNKCIHDFYYYLMLDYYSPFYSNWYFTNPYYMTHRLYYSIYNWRGNWWMYGWSHNYWFNYYSPYMLDTHWMYYRNTYQNRNYYYGKRNSIGSTIKTDFRQDNRISNRVIKSETRLSEDRERQDKRQVTNRQENERIYERPNRADSEQIQSNRRKPRTYSTPGYRELNAVDSYRRHSIDRRRVRSTRERQENRQEARPTQRPTTTPTQRPTTTSTQVSPNRTNTSRGSSTGSPSRGSSNRNN